MKKRTLQNNLSYALKYMFDNYGLNIFQDSQKFIITLTNLIPSLDEEIKLIEFALKKNIINIMTNAHNKREVDKEFASLRAKTLLTKNGISEDAALYIVNSLSYAFNWIDDRPDFENLSDLNFEIPAIDNTTKEINKYPKKSYSEDKSNSLIKKDSPKPSTKLEKKETPNKIEDTPKPIFIKEEKTSSKPNQEVQNDIKTEVDSTYAKNNVDTNKKESNSNINTKKEEPKKQEAKPNVNKPDSKYYLNHDLDDDSDDDEYYEEGSLIKKLALIIIPILILCCLAFFIFRNFNKEAEPVVSGISITTEYRTESGNYILPINQETDLNVIIQSQNSKKIDLSKLSFKIENPSMCSFKNDGRNCTITGLKEGSTKLIVMYNNEVIENINLNFKDFVKQEEILPKDNTEVTDETIDNPSNENTTINNNNNQNTNDNNNQNNSNNNSNQNKDTDKDKDKPSKKPGGNNGGSNQGDNNGGGSQGGGDSGGNNQGGGSDSGGDSGDNNQGGGSDSGGDSGDNNQDSGSDSGGDSGGDSGSGDSGSDSGSGDGGETPSTDSNTSE